MSLHEGTEYGENGAYVCGIRVKLKNRAYYEIIITIYDVASPFKRLLIITRQK